MAGRGPAPQWSLADRVKPSVMERMALQQPPQPHSYAAHDPVFFNRRHHVFRAGGIEPACRGQHRGDPSLIGTKNQERELHCAITFPSALSISSNVAPSTALRGLSTKSHCG